MPNPPKPNLTSLARGGMKIFISPVRGPRIATLAVLLGLLVLAIFARSPAPRKLDVSLQAPKTIRTADANDLQIAVKNRSREVLRDARLVLEAPASLEIQGERTILLGTLDRQEIKSIPLTVHVFVSLGEEANLTATLHAEDRKGRPIKEASILVVKPAESALTLELDVPKLARRGELMNFNWTLHNKGSLALDEACSHVSITKGSEPPKLSPNDLFGHCTSLAPGASTTQGNANDNRDAEFVFMVIAHTNRGNIIAQEARVIRTVSVELTIELLPDEPIFPGHEWVQKARVTNRDSAPLELMDLEARALTSSTIFADAGIYQFTHTPPFLGAGESFETEVHIPIKSDLPKTIEENDRGTQVFARLKDGNDEMTIFLKGITAKIIPAIFLQAEARYWSHEGDQLGRGPLPPRAGKETTYWIFAHPSVKFSLLTNPVVRFELGDGVALAENQSLPVGWTGPIREGEIFTITGPALAPGDEPVLGFAVKLTPSRAMIGKPATLIRAMRLEGVSGETRPVSDLGSILTTELTTDPRAQSKGVVQP